MVSVLVNLSHARALRTSGPVLDELLRRGHRVVVQLELADRHAPDGGRARAQAWAEERPGATVLLFGPRRWGRGRLAGGLRAVIDYAGHQPPRGGDAGPPTSIANRSIAWVPGWFHAVHRRLGGGPRRFVAAAVRAAERV